MASEADLAFRIYAELLYHIEDLPDFDDANIHAERESSIFTSKYTDIVITKKADTFPEELDQIENIEDWYPDRIFQVPVIEIEVKYQRSDPVDHSIIDEMQLGPPSSDYSLPEGYLVVHEDAIDSGSKSKFKKNDYVISTTGAKESIRRNVCHHILTPELAGFRPLPENHREAEDIISSIESKVFHYNEVKALYENQRIGPLIVLLSVFFESYCSERLEEYLKKHNPDSGESTFLSGRERFSKLLDMCEYYNIFEDLDYDADPIYVMKLCYNARNKYAHSLSRYHTSETTELERQNKIGDAIELYETLVGVTEGML